MRVRAKVSGTPERPRLSVYRSLKHVYVQVIDDSQGLTLAAVLGEGNVAGAKKAGEQIAEQALKAKVKKIVFDRGGRIYHGVVKAVADGAREKGLEF
ncbi:MAG: 50S ribosomal protein L18 [Elusimicrobia bacterium RIFCSPLOWO2_01_FULL_54_10]|nr:MAG: 50S ribosomal protein L18 [Elusimicrobia bacterium RIFCSPLOWO2_01_FULL_54_10]